MRKMDRSAVFGCNNNNNNNNRSLFHKINIDIPYYKNVNLNKAI